MPRPKRRFAADQAKFLLQGELLEQRINAGWIGSGDAIHHRNVWRSISSTAPRLSRCSRNASSRGRRDRL